MLLKPQQYGDPAAKACIKEIDKIRNSKDKKKVTAWEREILSKAYEDVRIITSTEYDHLNRIQQDRHRCAHPVLDNEGFLFQPTPELARTHIRTAIEVLLNQPPIIGKAFSEALIRDVETTSYFPEEIENVNKYLYKRHFQTSEKYRENLFKLIFKKILFLEPDEIKINETEIIERYILAFQSLLISHSQILELMDLEYISKIIEKTKEERYKFLIAIISIKPELWNYTPNFIQEKIKVYINQKNIYKRKERKEVLQALCFLPKLEDKLFDSYKNMDCNTKTRFLNDLEENNLLTKRTDLIKSIIQYNVIKFSSSGDFDNARFNYASLISPIEEILNGEDIKLLLEECIEKQNKKWYQLIYHTSYFIKIFQQSINKYPETLINWQNFIDKKQDRGYIDFSDLEKLVQNKSDN